MRALLETPAPRLARHRSLHPLLGRAAAPVPARPAAARTRPDAPRARGARRCLDQARPDARDALRPPPGRLLRRALQAAQPGPAVPVRAGPRDRPAGAGRPARGGLPDVRRGVVRGGLDRPGPSGHPPDRRARRGQGPAARDPRKPPGRHRPDVRLLAVHRLDPPVRGDPQPDGDRRVRPLDGRRARLPRRGPPGRPALRARPGRAVRADRPRLPRLLDVARPDRRAHRGHPADRRDRGLARSEHGLSRRPEGARSGPRSGRPAARLEHAQPGLRVRLLPRRPPPGQPVRAARRRDRLCRLRYRRPAARRRPRVAHALRLAAVPGRDRGGHRRAHALARADAGHRRGGRPAPARPRPPGVLLRHQRPGHAGDRVRGCRPSPSGRRTTRTRSSRSTS